MKKPTKDDLVWHICPALKEIPVPLVQSDIAHCSKCDALVWVARKQIMKPPPNAKKICWDCLRKWRKENPDEKMELINKNKVTQRIKKMLQI